MATSRFFIHRNWLMDTPQPANSEKMTKILLAKIGGYDLLFSSRFLTADIVNSSLMETMNGKDYDSKNINSFKEK